MAQALTSSPEKNSTQSDSPATSLPDNGSGTDSSSNPARGASLSVLQSWLDWQCRMLDGIVHASLFTVKPGAEQVFADHGQAHWPDQGPDPARLISQANAAIQKQATVVNNLSHSDSGGRQFDCVSIPLPLDRPRYVLSILIAAREPLRHADLSKLVQWSGYWLYEYVDTAGNQLISLLAECAACESALETYFHIVTQLADTLDCERVSLGLLDGRRVRLKTISGLSHFDHRMRLVQQIEQVMDEAIEQTAIVDSSANAVCVNPLHRELAAKQTGYCISIPLSDGAVPLGVITLERSESRPCDEREISWLSNLTALLTPVLLLHREREIGMGVRLRAAFSSVLHRHQNQPFHLRSNTRTVITLCAVIAVLALTFFKGNYRITSNVTIEGADKQVVVAPYPGFILASRVRAGEEVEAGEILASLDVSGLLVEKEKWLSELSKLDKRYLQALAAGDRVELSLATALREELTAELELVNQRVERSQVKAPFRGVVVSGDLNQSLGAPVEQGEVLFEIASMDQFRLMVDIEEQVIANIYEGQPGAVRLAAMPGVTHDVILKTRQPVAVSVSGKNVFRMEAEFVEPSTQFRPGMRGVAKIAAGKRPWLWLWTHKLSSSLRLWLWSVGF